jgi:uncharacterized protein (TIGR00730 family)
MWMARRAPLTDDEAMLAVPAPGRPATRRGDEVLLARVRAELETGFETLGEIERAISVFGSARTLPSDPDYELARRCAAGLGREGYAIITGGGPGIMEAANRGAREVDALSIGLGIELPVQEPPNPYLDVHLRFHYFFTRKVMFVRYATAFVVFPGGFGTLDELFELAALMQAGKVRTVPVVLVRRAYWEPLLDWLAGTVLGSGKILPHALELIALADDANRVCELLRDAAGRT